MRIRHAATEAMMAHARDELPNECCGLLVGTPGTIEWAMPARNLRASPTRYLIDPADHCAALRAARASGHDVVGVYHSHPAGPPQPSSTDRRDAYPEYLYLIVAPAPPPTEGDIVRAFRLNGDAFRPVALAQIA